MTRGPGGGADLPSLRGDHDLGWMDDAACRTPMPGFTTGQWWDVFFSTKSEPTWKLALAVCNRCPVKDQCRRAAEERREPIGVWGGVGAIGNSTHGTDGGYQAHRERNQDPCDECKAAHRAACRERRERKAFEAMESANQATAEPEKRPRRKPGPPRQPINHGTPHGAGLHRERDEDVCDECRDAERRYRQDLRVQERALKLAAS